MISFLMSNRDSTNETTSIKEFLPEKRYDLSLNLPSNLERSISGDNSTGLSLSFRSSSDSIFTLDQEEYLATSIDTINKIVDDNKKENKIDLRGKRQREKTYNDKYTKSPTPTKYLELLENNQKIVDEYR